jgi:excisionase family DNA binding protein
MLSISQRQIYKMAATNRIPNFKIGTSVRFDPDALREWLGEKTLVPKRRPPTQFDPTEHATHALHNAWVGHAGGGKREDAVRNAGAAQRTAEGRSGSVSN